MTEVRVELNHAGISELLTSPEITSAVGRVADAIASAAASAAGSHTVTTSDGAGAEVKTKVVVEMRRTSFTSGEALDDQPLTHSRARAAVLVSHPTPTGREAGMRALLGSLEAGRGAV